MTDLLNGEFRLGFRSIRGPFRRGMDAVYIAK